METPVYGSIILAGVLLKMGRYELICFIEIFYAVGVKYRYVIFRLRIADNIVVGILCLMQVDIKIIRR